MQVFRTLTTLNINCNIRKYILLRKKYQNFVKNIYNARLGIAVCMHYQTRNGHANKIRNRCNQILLFCIHLFYLNPNLFVVVFNEELNSVPTVKSVFI